MAKEIALWFVSFRVFLIYIILKKFFILYILDLHLEGLPSAPVKEAY